MTRARSAEASQARPNWQRLTAWLLAVAMTVLFSGGARSLHERTAHGHDPEAVHTHAHSEEAPAPAGSPGPLGHDDCLTCDLLSHTQASTLDLDAAVALAASFCFAGAGRPVHVLAADATRLPLTRGPPLTHL